MNAKAKLRLRHIEDADKSNATSASTEPATPLFAEPAPVSEKSEKTVPLQVDKPLLSETASSSSVGSRLQRARIERDLSVRDVAQQLRIQRSYLEALETGDFDNLPGLTYAIGYVRSYAQLLDLEADPLIAEFKAEAKKLQEPTQLSFPSPAPEGKVPGGALMFVGVLLAALSYGGWYYLSTSETEVSDLTPGIPDRLAFLLEEPAIDAPATVATTSETPIEPAAQEPMSQPSAAPIAEQEPATAIVEAPAPTQEPEAAFSNTASEEPAPIAAGTAAPASVASVTDAPSGVEAPAVTEPTTEPTETVSEPVASDADVTTATATASQATEQENETVPGTVEPAAEPPLEVASVPDQEPAVTDIPAVPDVTASSSSNAERSAVEAEAAAINTAPTAAPAASDAGPRIVIRATDDSWVQVRGEDATPLLTRILRKGEEYEVPVRTGLRLFTGNAGALKISIDGTEVPSLGPFGKIARNIPLDESLLTYSAAD